MALEQVGLNITADAAAVSAGIDESIKALRGFSREVDVFNSSAVAGFRKVAESEREINLAAGASEQQMRSLTAVTQTFEKAVDSAGTRSANATERMGRGFSMLARSGADSARSMNTIIAAAGDLAFSFGPEGAILSGVAMVAAGIIGHFEKAESKMEDIALKFDTHMNEMLANGSAIQSAKAAARAYIDELQAGAELITKTQKAASLAAGLAGTALGGLGIPSFLTGGAQDKLDAAKAREVAAQLSASEMATYEVHDKELKRLETRRHEANADIVRLTEQAAGLKDGTHQRELKAVRDELAAAEGRLSAFEKKTRADETDRAMLAAREAATLGGAKGAALQYGANEYTPADFAAEHETRGDELSRDRRGTEAKAGRTADSERVAQARRDQAAIDEIERLGVQAAEERAQHLDVATVQGAMAEMAVIEAKHKRELDKIDQMKLDDDLILGLQLAEDAREYGAVVSLNQKIEAENVRHRATELKEIKKAATAEERALQGKAHVIYETEQSMAQALIHSRKDLGRQLLRAALEPEVKLMEALSAKQFALAVGSWPDIPAMAHHAAAGAVFLTEAGVIAAIAGGGSSGHSGGGAGGSGGGGGGGFGAGTALGSSGNSSTQVIQIEIVNTTKDQNGREVAKTRQMIQRLTDQNMPIRVTM